jgi:nicotinamide mononucleotide adenylyltransferase
MKTGELAWKKTIHIESSMERKEGQFSLFVGRWQPLHSGHKEMFQQVLDEGGNVLIGIRDGEVNFKNPFTATEVMENIMEEYEELILQGRVKVQILPDIASIEFGRGVGYDIIERIPPTEVAQISATKIREEMKKEGKL